MINNPQGTPGGATRRSQARKPDTHHSGISTGFLVAGGLFLIGAAVLLVLLPGLQVVANLDDFSAIPIAVNSPAPQLTLTDLAGKPVSLQDYRGTIVLVNNWATWCPPCKAEMPTLQAFYAAHADQNFVIIAIESGEPISQVEDFVKEYGLTFPVWPDLHSLALDTFQNWDLPSSYLIDAEGTIRYSWNGAISRDMLEKYITPLLEE